MDVKNLPEEYVTRKFYEYGHKTSYYHGNNTYQCSCPICLEGKSFGKKRRCWWIPSKNLIYCFNCGRGWTPYNWIKQVGNLSIKDIAEEIQKGEYSIVNLDRIEPTQESETWNEVSQDALPKDSIDLTDPIQLDYYKGNSAVQIALKYIKDRRLDTAINRPSKMFLSTTDVIHRNRLVFPFYDINQEIAFYQSRAIGANIDGYKEDIRYLGKVGEPKSIFNLDKIDSNILNVYLFEGPIDSCFVKNGVAVAGISEGGKEDLTETQQNQLETLSLFHNFVWVLDSQWQDETARKKTEILLKNGNCVFIWPKDKGLKYKDFNEWAIAEQLDEIPQSILLQNISCSACDLWKLDINSKKEETDVSSRGHLLDDFNY